MAGIATIAKRKMRQAEWRLWVVGWRAS